MGVILRAAERHNPANLKTLTNTRTEAKMAEVELQFVIRGKFKLHGIFNCFIYSFTSEEGKGGGRERGGVVVY